MAGVLRLPHFHYEGRDLESMDSAVNYHDWILSIFDPFVGDKLLEVGAGTGSVSRMILERYNTATWLLEPSAMFAQLQRSLKDTPQRHLAFPMSGFLHDHVEFLAGQNIDTVFYVNVLEHVENDTAELHSVYQLLQPDGHVLVFSPALPWLFGKFDARVGHFRRYYLNEIKTKLADAGFHVTRAHYVDFPGLVGWWLLYRLLMKSDLSGASVGFYDRWVVPFLRVLEPSRWLPWGKSVLAVGRKPGSNAHAAGQRKVA